MKFIHIADTHLDMRFDSVGPFGDARRVEQLRALKEIVDYAKENNVQYIFIAGDFYEHQYIRESTINTVIKYFSEIPKVKIYITPGNHDPYLKNSAYSNYKFPDNVHIFKDFEIIEEDNANIYGYGFTDFMSEPVNIKDIQLKNNGKKNILIIHGDIYGSKSELKYNSMNLRDLEAKNFDYIALGHIHLSNYNQTNKIIYPGPLLSYKFGGSKDNGMVVGEFIDNRLNLEFIPLDRRQHEEIEIDISEIHSQEELINNINNMDLSAMNFIKIILVGAKSFEVNTIKMLELMEKENIIKIYDNSYIAENLEEVAEEFNLKGLFVKNQLEKIAELDDRISDMRLRLQKETDPGVILEKEKLIAELSKKQILNYRAIAVVIEEMRNM